MKSPQPRNKKRKIIPSVAEMGRQVGRDRGSVLRWTRRDDWPFGRPPWPTDIVPRVRQWASGHVQHRVDARNSLDDADVQELKKEKLRKEIRKLHAQADLAEAQSAKEYGRLLDAGEVEREWAEICKVVRAGVAGLAGDVAARAAMMGLPVETVGEFERQVSAAIIGILARMVWPTARASSEGHGP
jgi:hypothetical protein